MPSTSSSVMQGFALALVTALAATLTPPATASAQTAAGAEAEASAAGAAQVDSDRLQLAAGATLHAVLETKLDARRAKVDDAVTARTTQAVDAQTAEALTIPRGSKLLGRITAVEAGAAGEARSDSRVGVIFDRVVLPDGRELAADLEVQALAAAEAAADTGITSPSVRTGGSARSGASARGGLLGGATGALGTATDVVTHTTGSLGAQVDATRIDSELSTSTVGVVGLQGLSLEASGSSSTIVSTRGPLVLRSGTRMLLRARASAH